jgi:TonB family protein
MALYPPLLRDAGITGTALLEVVTDEQGRVQENRVVRASHEAFGEAARQAAMSARFSPARSGGHPVPSRFTLPVHFDLPPSDADLPVISTGVSYRVTVRGEGGSGTDTSPGAVSHDPVSTAETRTTEAQEKAIMQQNEFMRRQAEFVRTQAELESVPQRMAQTIETPKKTVWGAHVRIGEQFEETHALIRRAVEDRYPEVFSHGLSRDKYLWFLVGPGGEIEQTGVAPVEWGWNGWNSTSIRRTLQSKFPEIQIQHSHHSAGLEMGPERVKVNVAWVTRLVALK